MKLSAMKNHEFDAMNQYSKEVNENLTAFLVRQAADKDRAIIRKEFEVQLNNISKNVFLFGNASNSNGHFTYWGTALAHAEAWRLQKEEQVKEYKKALKVYENKHAEYETRQRQGYYSQDGAPIKPEKVENKMPAMLVKEAEGIWQDHEMYDGDLKNKQILKMGKFLERFKESGYAVQTINFPSRSIQEYYTTKAGYYQSRVRNASLGYAKIKRNFIEKMENVNQWEINALKASGVQLSQEAYQSEVVYDRILTAWEKMTNPVKIAALDSNDVDDQIVKCLEDNADVSCQANSSEKVLNENDVNVSHVEHADYAELNLEENEFLKLWDKYNDRLEELLAHRDLNRYPKAQSCTCSADKAKSA